MKRFLCILLVLYCMHAQSVGRKIGVIGTGYVGLVVGACLADMGNKVICCDNDAEKIAVLNNGHIPIFEPGLKELVAKVKQQGAIEFSADPEQVVQKSDIIFIAVGTPMNEEGEADLSAVKAVARLIGSQLKQGDEKLIVTKSTVPIGTGAEIKRIILKHSQGKGNFEIVSNPEFLREGSAIKDFLKPDRIVIGAESEHAYSVMNDIYQVLLERKVPFVYTTIPTAETIKYASNSFLAVKVSFINEIAQLCDVTGADINMVSEGVGSDPRIGRLFFKPGPGFGGSCFPKDLQALLYKGRSSSVELRVAKAALEANNGQKQYVFEKLARLLKNDLKGKTIALLGLAFKANTDDVRYSPAITMIENLLEAGAHIKAYDPEAIQTMKKLFPSLEYGSSLYEVVAGADAIALLTEWDEFRVMDLAKVRALVRQPIILDARNILSCKKLKQLGFTYENIGNAHV